MNSKNPEFFSNQKNKKCIAQNILQNKIKQIKKEMQNKLEQSKKRQSLLQNGLMRIAKMQNLTQNELDQITKMQNQSRDELEQIAEMRRIKNYKKMSKEGLIISLLRISEIKKILNKLRDIFTKEYRKKIKKKL